MHQARHQVSNYRCWMFRTLGHPESSHEMPSDLDKACPTEALSPHSVLKRLIPWDGGPRVPAPATAT